MPPRGWMEFCGSSPVSIRLHLYGWSQAQHFVVIRELERGDKSAPGRRLIGVPGCTY